MTDAIENLSQQIDLQGKQLVAMRDALIKITELDPEKDSTEGYNEWGEVECFIKAQKLAREVLAGKIESTQEPFGWFYDITGGDMKQGPIWQGVDSQRICELVAADIDAKVFPLYAVPFAQISSDVIGQALSDYMGQHNVGNVFSIDPFDSHNIDDIAEHVLHAIKGR